jgi:2-polyprenyl-6-methoxyphenol hydroxylase-like FAD-dependent oxidoreductase
MEADVVIVGGGPAGMMAGLLFARAGINTTVLEKHGDFLRDFRGDTVHPSTMEILDQLGILEKFLNRPFDKVESITARVAGERISVADTRFLKTPAPFIAMMPQWEFLDFLRDEAETYPTFTLRVNAEVTGVVEENGRVAGVRLAGGEEVRAGRLVIMADGRKSAVRQMLPIKEIGAPMDIFWFSVPKPPTADNATGAVFEAGRILVMIDRGDYWQCASVIPKGGADQVRAAGIEAFRKRTEAAAPELGSLDNILTSMDQLNLLSVALDRLEHWSKPGLLAIGDAAHAMSPIGGVGINLAIQDAVATANILAAPIKAGRNVDHLLVKVELRRLLPTRIIQALQKLAQDNVIGRLIAYDAVLTKPPLALRLLKRFPRLRRIPARLIGLGFRREHVKSPAV